MLHKMSFCRSLPLFLAVVATCTLSEVAGAATFTFSFSNVRGLINGTVQGTIELPDGDGTFAAPRFLLLSPPSV
ncbi:hypothetical protein V0288_21600 [Pannus brasiliensis CCIBt3594]|uniref:Uncharacterized protein n=1 Tax=Pannus brasiliensis CCIBt3594 TaxID=1427578 RepID=A0AAW9QRT0_9CHRO